MAARKITTQPPDMTRLLFSLGQRTLVLLEGDADFDVMHEWYRDRQDRLMFSVAVGVQNLERLLEEFLDRSASKNAYGIIDRDFRTEIEVEGALRDPDAHLFILKLYSIENYLLVPSVLWEELQTLEGSRFQVSSGQEMNEILLGLCRSLQAMMAANWVFSAEKTIEYFAYGHNLADRKTIVALAAKRLACKQADADQRIAGKEREISPTLTAFPEAHTYINGKHLLFHLHSEYIGQGFDRERLIRLLAAAIKRRAGIPADVRRIVEGRILGDPAFQLA